jgi:hypothetical protein
MTAIIYRTTFEVGSLQFKSLEQNRLREYYTNLQAWLEDPDEFERSEQIRTNNRTNPDK